MKRQPLKGVTDDLVALMLRNFSEFANEEVSLRPHGSGPTHRLPDVLLHAAQRLETLAKRDREATSRIAALESELADIKEKGTSYMLEVDRMLQQAARDGLTSSAYLHTKTVTDVVRHIFGEVH